jgi:hypothetical protein
MLLAPSAAGNRDSKNRIIVLVLIGSYLLLVFVLPVALSVLVSYRALPQGSDCPHCRGDTIRLQSPRLDLASRASPFASLHRRWCLCCGWEGTSRLVRDRRKRQHADVPLPTRKDDAARRRAASPRRRAGGKEKALQGAMKDAAATQTLDVRSLDVDGAPWRVMLQCWKTTELYYGRLVFVGPSGRLWLDAVESLSGRSEHEVLGQALSLPDGMLANRLRRLVSDR